MLSALESAFAGREGAPEVLVRAHPAMPRVAALLKTRGLKAPLRDGTGEPLAEAWEWTDAVLYASSTLGVEAVHRGIPAIFFDIGGFLSVDPGFRLGALKRTVSDAKLSDEILAGARRALRARAGVPPSQHEGKAK